MSLAEIKQLKIEIKKLKELKELRNFKDKKEKFQNKKMSELTMTELLEDLGYYVKYAQYQSPSFVDQTFNCIWEDIIELFRRFKI